MIETVSIVVAAGIVSALVARLIFRPGAAHFVLWCALWAGSAFALINFLFTEPSGAWASVTPAPVETASKAEVVRIHRDQLVPIRGRVLSVSGESVTIDCPAPVIPPKPDFSAPIWQLGPTAGNKAVKNVAKIAAKQEAEYEAAVRAAASVVSGTILLTGHPRVRDLREGMPIEVVAAPVNRSTYTMNYELQNTSPRSAPTIPAPLSVSRPLTPDEQNAEIARRYGAQR